MKEGATVRASYVDFYGCKADLCQRSGGDSARLTIRTASGNIIHRKEYRTWRGAKIAMGKCGDCWQESMTNR